MKKTSSIFIAVSAVLFFGGAALAADNVLLAVNKPAPKAVQLQPMELAPQTTAQILLQAGESGDFDALSAVNDPLYREGSKEFLQQVSKQDAVKVDNKEPVKTILRDAPNSPAAVPAAVPAPVKVQPVLRRSKLMKVIPADPVKSKNTF